MNRAPAGADDTRRPVSRQSSWTESDGRVDGEIAEGADGNRQDTADAWSHEYDRTTETLRLLRTRRRAHRAQRNRDLAVAGYVVLLLAVGYGGTLGYRFAQRLARLAAQDGTVEALRSALPTVLMLLACGLAVLAARDALWRGPVLVSRPDVSWLLTQPVRRERVLRPAFRSTAALMTAGGVLCAVGGAVLLRLTGLAPLGPALALCLPAGVCLPLLAAALALRVERGQRLPRRVRASTPYAVLLLAALAGQAVWAVASQTADGGPPPGLRLVETVELWSGPWGWAAQPVVHAAGGQAPGWPAGVGLLVAATVAAVAHAEVTAARIPTRHLRARAATATTVASVLWSVELRVAKLAIADALTGDAPAARRHLPAPPSRRFAIVWRDAAALLRAPARPVGAALWTAAGAGATGLAADLDGAARIVVLAVALTLGWAGVSRLAETARLEADDLRRSSWSPFRFASLMVQHTVVPAVVGAVLALLAAVPFAAGGAAWALLLMPLCAPVFAAAAVLGAVRGPVRTELLSMGLVTPAGDVSGVLFLSWYAAPFLAGVGTLTAVLGTSAALDPAAPAGALVGPVTLVAGLTAVLLFAVVRRSKALRRTAG